MDMACYLPSGTRAPLIKVKKMPDASGFRLAGIIGRICQGSKEKREMLKSSFRLDYSMPP
jgi:hypothetical protein